MVRALVKRLLGRKLIGTIRSCMNSPKRIVAPYYKYNIERMIQYSAAFGRMSRECRRAIIIMNYHILEKGLTMPNRRYGFGSDVLKNLIKQVDDFEKRFGRDEQVDHAVGVIRAYFELHRDMCKTVEGDEYWGKISRFLSNHQGIVAARQPHVRRVDFYADRQSVFPDFARSRHTVRHYANKDLPMEKIKQAVDLARSTPTACNRQHCRVYCVSDKMQMEKLLAIQGGNRGFGHLANKVLIVTADLQDICSARERDDVFVNGGMFLLNLCYALHYYEVAHCILNWSRKPDEDKTMRNFMAIPPSETVIALLTCGEAPDVFDFAASPRKRLEEVLVVF